MFDPFRLFGRILLASFRIGGYVLSYAAQAVWYLLHGRSDKVGEVFGFLGSRVTDAIADIFRR